ncbi:MAG: HD domain-containing protein [Bacteroidales bacterium]|nr:HD domain-containing protein [Bacteroidales bacterium]
MKTTKVNLPVERPITPEEEAFIEEQFQGLLNDYAHTRKGDKADLIKRVFEFAKKANGNLRRLSGEPQICHELAVARIVSHDIGMGSTSICAALMHDIVANTDTTFEEIDDTFGERIGNLIRGLNRISGNNFRFVTEETSDASHRGIKNPEEQAENFRNLLLTMCEDIRVILVKIADRLHNMRTLSALSPFKQKRIANETLYLYAPLAYRLGLFSIKSELEDLSLKYEHPEEYEELKQKLKDSEESRDRLFATFSAPIIGLLDGLGLKYTFKERMKSLYSIWNKMHTKHVPFEQVYDLFAARIVFTPQSEESEKTDCWRIYTAITSVYKLHPDRIRDWISHPKSNGYEALHVTVMGPDGNWIEIQIRSERMDEIAEHGLAVHWKYKRGKQVNEADNDLDKWVKSIKNILDDPNPNALDFLDTIKLNVLSTEIYVFTPAGDLKELPKGATALDFAFDLHTHIGLCAEAARINHELMPLSTELESGQQVEIITSPKETCQLGWAAFVTTSKARSAVRSYLNKHFPEEMALALKKQKDLQRTSTTQKLLGMLHLKKKKKEKPVNDVFRPEQVSTTLELAGIDTRGSLNTISRVIFDCSTANITDIQFTCKEGLFTGHITLDTANSKVISQICNELKKLHEVQKVSKR